MSNQHARPAPANDDWTPPRIASPVSRAARIAEFEVESPKRNLKPHVRKRTELAVRVPNEARQLQRLLATLEESDDEVVASHAHYSERWMLVLVVSRSPARTKQAIENAGFKCWCDDVIVVEG